MNTILDLVNIDGCFCEKYLPCLFLHSFVRSLGGSERGSTYDFPCFVPGKEISRRALFRNVLLVEPLSSKENTQLSRRVFGQID